MKETISADSLSVIEGHESKFFALVDSYKMELQKVKKGNNAAKRRARKALQEIKREAQEGRKLLLEI